VTIVYHRPGKKSIPFFNFYNKITHKEKETFLSILLLEETTKRNKKTLAIYRFSPLSLHRVKGVHFNALKCYRGSVLGI